ncbi:MAG: signal peptide protein [Moraxellaceae bacterium]|jgi:anti-sigma factor ChrR (cupin superfamily)|nr:signal peptide protein [Moraxellaceae bacterium]
MNPRPAALPLLALLVAMPALAAPPAGTQPAGSNPSVAAFHHPDTLQWTDVPPNLPRGARLAILSGDPFQRGPFVIRLQVPAGYTLPPHWHSMVENVTVLSGSLHLGMGDVLDVGAARELPAGGFHSISARVHHFAFSPSGAVVQIHGEGPFDIQYVNPSDNPDPDVIR